MMLCVNCDHYRMETSGQAFYRWSRLWRGAHTNSIPLGAILTGVATLVTVALVALLSYELRQVLVIIFLASFFALLLNPLVIVVQRWVVRRRGAAVVIVLFLWFLFMAGLALTMAHPLVASVTNLSNQLPSFVTNAEHDKSWIGQIAYHYHLQVWVRENAPRLVMYVKELAGPALGLGAGTISIALSVTTFLTLIIVLLLEGPRLRRGVLSLMAPSTAAEVQSVSSEVNRLITGYMLGNCLTSLSAGVTIFLTLFAMGVPYALLWALWFALLDLIPTIGSLLAAVPIILFALSESLTAGIVTLVICIGYNQIESHILAPLLMSKIVRISSTLIVISVLIIGDIGALLDGPFGGAVGALSAIPVAGAIQVVTREVWRLTAPLPAADPAELSPSLETKAQPASLPELEHSYIEQVILQLENRMTAAEAFAGEAREFAERTQQNTANTIDQLSRDNARGHEELTAALEAKAVALTEVCAVLRQRAERAERALEQGNAGPI